MNNLPSELLSLVHSFLNDTNKKEFFKSYDTEMYMDNNYKIELHDY